MRRARVDLESTPTDTYASLSLTLPGGRTRCHLGYRGGVRISTPAATPTIGSVSRGIHLGSVRWEGATLRIEAYAQPRESATITLGTNWQPLNATGAAVMKTGPDTYELKLDGASTSADAPSSADGYTPHVITVRFKTH